MFKSDTSHTQVLKVLPQKVLEPLMVFFSPKVQQEIYFKYTLVAPPIYLLCYISIIQNCQYIFTYSHWFYKADYIKKKRLISITIFKNLVPIVALCQSTSFSPEIKWIFFLSMLWWVCLFKVLNFIHAKGRNCYAW